MYLPSNRTTPSPSGTAPQDLCQNPVLTYAASEILPDDPEDPMRTAMRQMMGVFAQLDRGMTVAKLCHGRRIKGEKDQYAYGALPYGWQAHKKELTKEEIEQASRARARQLRDEDELSLREVCAVLEAEDIRPKREERWHPETVRRMLANTADPAEEAGQDATQEGKGLCRAERSSSERL